MSALGQKLPRLLRTAASAFPPIADTTQQGRRAALGQ